MRLYPVDKPSVCVFSSDNKGAIHSDSTSAAKSLPRYPHPASGSKGKKENAE